MTIFRLPSLALCIVSLALSFRVSSAQVAPQLSLEKWDLPEGALFFRGKPDADWYKTEPKEREWIQVGRVSSQLFDALSPSDVSLAANRGYEEVTGEEQKKSLQQQAVREWEALLRPSWLPKPEVVTVASLQRRALLGKSEQPEFFAHSAFQGGAPGKRWRAVIFGVLGRGFHLYIEQSEPLANEAALNPVDMVRAEALPPAKKADQAGAWTPLAFAARELKRERAFVPSGPYEPVRVLILRFQPPQDLTLFYPGYEPPSAIHPVLPG